MNLGEKIIHISLPCDSWLLLTSRHSHPFVNEFTQFSGRCQLWTNPVWIFSSFLLPASALEISVLGNVETSVKEPECVRVGPHLMLINSGLGVLSGYLLSSKARVPVNKNLRHVCTLENFPAPKKKRAITRNPIQKKGFEGEKTMRTGLDFFAAFFLFLVCFLCHTHWPAAAAGFRINFFFFSFCSRSQISDVLRQVTCICTRAEE